MFSSKTRKPVKGSFSSD